MGIIQSIKNVAAQTVGTVVGTVAGITSKKPTTPTTPSAPSKPLTETQKAFAGAVGASSTVVQQGKTAVSTVVSNVASGFRPSTSTTGGGGGGSQSSGGGYSPVTGTYTAPVAVATRETVSPTLPITPITPVLTSSQRVSAEKAMSQAAQQYVQQTYIKGGAAPTPEVAPKIQKTAYFIDQPGFQKGFMTSTGEFIPSTSATVVPAGYKYKEPTEKPIYDPKTGQVVGVQSSFFKANLTLDAYQRSVEAYEKAQAEEKVAIKKWSQEQKETQLKQIPTPQPQKTGLRGLAGEVIGTVIGTTQAVSGLALKPASETKETRITQPGKFTTGLQKGIGISYAAATKPIPSLVSIAEDLRSVHVQAPGATTRSVRLTPEVEKQLAFYGEKPIITYKPTFASKVLSGSIPTTIGQAGQLALEAQLFGAASRVKFLAPVIETGFTYLGGKSIKQYFGAAEGSEEQAKAAAGTLGLIGALPLVARARYIPADILAIGKKPSVVETTFFEPKRGEVPGQIVTFKSGERLLLKETPSQYAGEEILELQGKKIKLAHVTGGNIFQYGRATTTVQNIPGSIVSRPFEGGLYVAVPEAKGILKLYDPKALAKASEIDLTTKPVPTLPKITAEQGKVISSIREEVLGGSFAGETLFKGFREHKDLDIISKNPKDTALRIVSENPELKAIKGTEGKYKIVEKATGKGIADIATPQLYNKNLFGEAKYIKVNGVNILSPENLLSIKIKTIERAGEASRVKAAKDISFISAGEVKTSQLLKPTKTTGEAQAYTYYALGGEGTLAEASSGKATFNWFGSRPKIFIGEETVGYFPKEILSKKVTPKEIADIELFIGQMKKGEAPGVKVTPEQGTKEIGEIIKRAGGTVEGLARQKRIAEYASKTPGLLPGVGSSTGYKPEREAMFGAGTGINKVFTSTRAKVGRFFGFGEVPIKTKKATFEVSYIKMKETPKVIGTISQEKAPAYDFNAEITKAAREGFRSSQVKPVYNVQSALTRSVSKLGIPVSISPSKSEKSLAPISVSQSRYSLISPISKTSLVSKISLPSYLSRVSGISKVSSISQISPVSPKYSVSIRSPVSPRYPVSIKYPKSPTSIKYPVSLQYPRYPVSTLPSNLQKSTPTSIYNQPSIKKGGAFNVEVKERGKWKSLNVALSEKQAGLFAQKRLKESLAASARLVPTKKKLQESFVRFAPRPGEFRQYQISKGKKIFNPRLFIQNVGGKSKGFSRLGTRAEKTEIQIARQTIGQTRKKGKGGFFK